jgi:glutathione synthase/RimK-type ligase-like ATP-grasp enzyme
MTGYAVVLGITHEPPIAGLLRQLTRLALPHFMIDQRRLAGGDVHSWWADGAAGGLISVGRDQIPLEDVTGVYTRLTDWSVLPGISVNPEMLERAYHIHHALESWLEVTSARVVNRTSVNDTNNSKPYQALIIRQHFDIPATLVTNDPERAQAFRDDFREVIYKSISGERSIVATFSDQDIDRLPLLMNSPVQFQEHIAGVDVRVHVVGSDVFATRVESSATDYRYDESGIGLMAPFRLPGNIADECILLTHRLGLELSGIDLRFADDGRVVCFEVNPSPAYIVYEDATGQPITTTLARHVCAC